MSASMIDPPINKAIQSSATALRRMAGYTLPAELDQRILHLAERKEALTSDEQAELLAWVSFTQQRTIEKFEAQLALRQLASAFPDLASKS